MKNLQSILITISLALCFFLSSPVTLQAGNCQWYATELYCFDMEGWIDTHCCSSDGGGNSCNCGQACTFDCDDPPIE